MQRATCKVRLAGDLGNEVQKLNVSPAEIAILRDLHGGYDSVKDIQPTSMDKSPHADERRRLASIYGQHVVDRIFPGQYNPLPVTLKDIEPKPSLDEEAANADSKRVTATVPMDPGNAIIPPTVPVNAMGPKQPTMNTVAPPGGLFHQDPPAEKAPPQGGAGGGGRSRRFERFRSNPGRYHRAGYDHEPASNHCQKQ